MGQDDDVSSSADEHGEAAHGVAIIIDGLAYEVEDRPLHVRALRELTHPPIAGDRDVWLEGGAADRFLLDDELIEPKPGLRIFTAPRTIVAG